jgi:alkaline phosphatase D
MAQIDTRADCIFDAIKTEPFVWTDGWSGYAAARQRIIDLMAQYSSKNPVVMGGDIHAHFVNRILKDWKKSDSPTVAPEFVTTAISSHLRNWEPLRSAGSGNERNIVDLDCRNHGYVLCDVTKDTFDVRLMRVSPNAFEDDISKTKAEVSMKYRVTAGSPEPRKV